MSSTREAGWGLHEKATRFRQAEEQKRVVKHDANEAFVFKRPTRQPPPGQAQQQQQPQPLSSPPAASPSPVAAAPAPAPAPPAPSPQAATPQAAATPVAQPSPTPTAPEMSSSSYPAVSAAHARESVAPSRSPSAAAGTASSGSGSSAPPTAQSNLLCSCLVELFEMIGSNPAPKAYGPKGVTLLRLPNAGAGDAGAVPFLFQLLVYAPVSKKAELSVDVDAHFAFTMLPDRFAAFEDAATGRSWCVKFGSSEDAFSMARSFALIAEMRIAAAYAAECAAGLPVAPRGILAHDLAVGAPDTPALGIGDQMKCRYTVYEFDAAHPFAPLDSRAKIFSTASSSGGKDASGKEKDSSKKLIVGEGGLMSRAVEEALVGMRKKGTRLLIIPPNLAAPINQRAEWGPHVRPDATLLVEVAVTGVRNSLPLNAVAGESPAPEGDAFQAEEQSQQPQSFPSLSPQAQAQEEAVAAAGGAYNPPAASSQSMDLKSRMAALAGAQHANGVSSNAATTTTAPASSVRPRSRSRSISPVQPRRAALVVDNDSANSSSTDPSIESLLSELQLQDLLPNFRREGVTLSDLLLLDQDELRQIVPQMGPRRRISARIVEIQQRKAAAAAAAGATTGLMTPSGAFSPLPPAHPTTKATATAEPSPPYRQRVSSAADRDANSPQSQQATPSAVPNVAARYAAAAAASSGQQAPAPYRARTYSEVLAEDGPAPAPVAALAAAAPSRQQPANSSSALTTQQQQQSSLEALLAAEYERGRSDTIALAKEKISDMKETASARFASMQAQLDEANRRNEKDRDTAREAVQRLREELRAATAAREAAESSLSSVQSEKDSLADKSQKYVAQLRARMAEASEQAAAQRRETESASIDVVRASLERVFTSLHAQVKPKELYEGTEVLALVRAILKQTSTEVANK